MANKTQKEAMLLKHAGVKVRVKPFSNNRTPHDPWYWMFSRKNAKAKTFKNKRDYTSSLLGDQFVYSQKPGEAERSAFIDALLEQHNICIDHASNRMHDNPSRGATSSTTRVLRPRPPKPQSQANERRQTRSQMDLRKGNPRSGRPRTVELTVKEQRGKRKEQRQKEV